MTTKKTGDAGTDEPLISMWKERERLMAGSRAAASKVRTAGDEYETWSMELLAMASEIERQIVETDPRTVAGMAIQAHLLADFVDDGIMVDGLDAILARRLSAGLAQMARV